MKKKILFLFKVLLFMGILSICICQINDILVPKYIDDDGGVSSTYNGFYKMEKNSIDVIFLGSSRAACAFSPQELYDRYKIRSYNLGCEMQNVLVSYYWLRETLRFQEPKVVVLETTMIFPWDAEQVLNTSIESTQKALDNMKWSNVKCEAIYDICKYDETQSWEGYYFPNIQYHERWEELTRVDFVNYISGESGLKGQIMYPNSYISWNEERFSVGQSYVKEEMHDLMKKYLDRIVDLCQKKDIHLILASAPSAYGSIERYNSMAAYAETNNLYYVDYNEMEKNESIQYNYEMDNAEYSHVGLSGTYKVAEDIGRILVEEFGIEGIEDDQWEVSRDYYLQTVKEYKLCEIYDAEKYFKELNDPNYMVFMVARNVFGYKGLPESIVGLLKNLSLKDDFWTGNSGDRYCAVINRGDVIEQNQYVSVRLDGTILQSGIQYSLQSDGERSSLLINGVEYIKPNTGLSIVVFDLVKNKVIDSVEFNFENSICSIER